MATPSIIASSWDGSCGSGFSSDRGLPPSRSRGRSTVIPRFSGRNSMRQDKASANGGGVAPESIDGGIGLASVLQTTQSGLVNAGALGHGRQRQPRTLPRLLQIMDQHAHEEVGPALDWAFVGPA